MILGKLLMGNQITAIYCSKEKVTLSRLGSRLSDKIKKIAERVTLPRRKYRNSFSIQQKLALQRAELHQILNEIEDLVDEHSSDLTQSQRLFIEED